MFNVLLVPVNDLISHPIENRFTFIAKKMMENFGVNIFVLRYTNIPTSSKRKRKLNFESVKFKDFKPKNIGSYYAMNTIPILSALSSKLKNERIDVIIHANILPSTIAVELGRIFHKPLIYDFQDYFPESATSYFKGTLMRSLTYAVTSHLTKFNIKYSNAVVTVTDAHKEKIKETDPFKLIKVIPNGVDTNLFKPISRSRALKELKMEEFEDKTILIYFGSIDPWLDFSTVFRVMRRLVKKGYDILLFVVGFCHSRYYIEELKVAAESVGVGKRLCFFDPVPQDKLVYFINASDVVLVPYEMKLKNQAVPLKVLESIACKKFVCVTKLPEILNRFGDVVGQYSSAEELEYALLRYIKGKMEIPGSRMNEIVLEYSWDNIASSYYDLMRQLASDYYGHR